MAQLERLSAYLQRHFADHNWGRQYQQTIDRVLKNGDVQRFLTANAAELTEATVDAGAAKLFEYVKLREELDAGATPPIPGYEPQLVMSNHQIDIAYQPSADKVAADAQRAKASLVTVMNMPKDIRGADLLAYDQQDRTEALAAATMFVNAVVKPDRGHVQGLYLTGAFGVGKTYLLGAIANGLADFGVGTTLLHFPTFAVNMKGSIATNTVTQEIDRVKRAPVLMLDDIGAESWSAWLRDDVLGVILQYRMQEDLPTCFSSNKTMDELENFFAGREQGISETVKAQRIMQRIRFLSREIAVGGRNRRPQ